MIGFDDDNSFCLQKQQLVKQPCVIKKHVFTLRTTEDTKNKHKDDTPSSSSSFACGLLAVRRCNARSTWKDWIAMFARASVIQACAYGFICTANANPRQIAIHPAATLIFRKSALVQTCCFFRIIERPRSTTATTGSRGSATRRIVLRI